MTATWADVARKDIEDAVRSRVLWSLVAVFVAFLVTSLLAAEELFPDAVVVDARTVLAGVAMLSQLFVPGVALAVGYLSIAGERRSGSLRVLLSYPFSRSAVVVGKLVGRTAITVAALSVGFVVASVLVVALYGAPDPGVFAGFVGAGVLLAAAFTGLAVGASAVAATRGRAMALAFGPFVASLFFWKPAIVGLYYAVNGTLPGVRPDRWYLLLKRLDPLEAYRVLVASILDVRVDPVPNLPLEDVPVHGTAERLAIADRVVGDVPFYLQEWTAVVVLLAWGLVPVAIGYRRFLRADLE